MTDIPLYNASMACQSGQCEVCTADDCFHPCHTRSEVLSEIKEGLVVRSGDTLILKIDMEHLRSDYPEQLNDFMEAIQAQLPKGAKVVFQSLADMAVIRKDEAHLIHPGWRYRDEEENA